MTDKSGNLLEDSRASQWLKDNAHNYGFIVRFQAGKEASTGYMPEAWHIRYVGKEAKDIHDSGLSLEEYFGIEGGDYAASSKPAESKPATTVLSTFQRQELILSQVVRQSRRKPRFQAQSWPTMTRG